ALGGVMGRVTDRAGIQFKMLNRGRGPAVWSPRAQCDKALYSAEMLRLLDGVAGLEFVEGLARRVRVRDARVTGVELTDGRFLSARAVVITPGTFLNGVLHIGDRQLAGGRRPARRRGCFAARSTLARSRWRPATIRRSRSRTGPSGWSSSRWTAGSRTRTRARTP